MPQKVLKKKYGIVVLLDALGASTFSEGQIREFLSARHEINEIIKRYTSKEFLKPLGNIGKFHEPDIFTFGDTVIITIPLRSKNNIQTHLWIFSLLMKRYLFHAMERGILFRGSFSIGNYIADSDSNTVMGEAVSDAAAWYENAEWAGLASTPKTNTVIEFYLSKENSEYTLKNAKSGAAGWLEYYKVPMKDGVGKNLYVISWPDAFFDPAFIELSGHDCAEQHYLELMCQYPVPKGTEIKYENTHKYFNHSKKRRANNSIQPNANASAD